MARRTPVSDAELEVLKVLWAGGPATVRDVATALRKQRRRLAYNTVLTLLSRLRDKGYVTADRRELPVAELYRLPTADDRSTTTLEPGTTFAVFVTAPNPVVTPQPISAATSSGTSPAAIRSSSASADSGVMPS